jgi:hypothetical protein
MPSVKILGMPAAESIEDYLEQVRRTREEWRGDDKFWKPWFRGQACESWDLRPQLYRNRGRTLADVLDDEEEFRLEFERRGLQLVGNERIPESDIEWYFLMQHYGAPTRLLDWTDGALMGLYFAVDHRFHKLDPDLKKDAAVWVLDPDWLNKKTTTKKDDIEGVALPEWPIVREYLPEKFEEEKLGRKYPLAIDPTQIARRLAVQRSRFTIHGSVFDGLEEIARRARRPRLRKLVVARKAVKPIREDLETCGISYSTLFPDLAGLGRELKRLWSTP